jgi:DNA primase
LLHGCFFIFNNRLRAPVAEQVNDWRQNNEQQIVDQFANRLAFPMRKA